MPISLVPKERRFYDLFEKQAANIVAATTLLSEITDSASAQDRQSKLKDFEHAGDDLTHETIRLLQRTFVTPFDREDIYALTSGMDDLLDYADEIADTVVLYQPKLLPEAFTTMAALILQAAQQLETALRNLYDRRDMSSHWIEIHRLENEGDATSREAIAALFRDGLDAIEVIKLKDIFTLLEDALDRCEDVANVIESIVIKHA